MEYPFIKCCISSRTKRIRNFSLVFPEYWGNNSVSFTALPGGYYDGSVVTAINAIASFWFKDEVDATFGRGFKLYYNNVPDTGDIVNSEKNTAFSVRCLRITNR